MTPTEGEDAPNDRVQPKLQQKPGCISASDLTPTDPHRRKKSMIKIKKAVEITKFMLVFSDDLVSSESPLRIAGSHKIRTESY